MAEYIEREAANKFVCQICDTSEGTFCVRCDGNPLKSIPAADVVEVVRCRDCVWWSDITAVSYPDAHECRRTALYKLPDFYCAHGKRKDGGQDE